MRTSRVLPFLARWPTTIPAIAVVIIAFSVPPFVREVLLTVALGMITTNGLLLERKLVAIRS